MFLCYCESIVWFQFTHKGGSGAKGKVPWIEYNGVSICDSHFIMQYLNKHFSK